MVKRTGTAWIAAWIAVTGVALLVTHAPVEAVVIDSVDTDFDVEFMDGADDVFLNSSVTCTVGNCRITYSMRHAIADTLVRVRWRDINAASLLNAGTGFGFINTWIKLDTHWGGVILPNPPAVRVVGEADFSQSIGLQRAPCLQGLVCDATYHDWQYNVPAGVGVPVGGPGGGTGDGAQSAAFGAAALTAQALPAGFESVTATSSTLAALVPDPNAPDDIELATEEILYRFASTVEQVGAQFRYLYTAANETFDEILFDVPELGFSGTLEGEEEASMEVISNLGPGFLLTQANVLEDDASAVVLGARFNALVPVPLPPALGLLLAGMGSLIAVRRGRWARRAPRRRPSRGSGRAIARCL